MPPKPKEPWPIPSPNYQGSLGDYKESVSPTRRNFARQPTYESPGDAYVRLNKNNSSIFQEVKSMLDPKNLTGANAIQSAIQGNGMSTTERITTGLTGIVQGLGFAMGGSKPKEVLIHGGPAKLKGGVINPKFVKGSTESGTLAGNTAQLNSSSLSMAESNLSGLTNNINFMKEQMGIKGSFANTNKAETVGQIKNLETKLAHETQWIERAKKDNYYSAVGDANSAYGHEGAYHLVTPSAKNVNQGLGPAGEYQVVGSSKPVKSFSTEGKTIAEQNEIAKMVNAYADRLKKPSIAPIIAASKPNSKKVPRKK